MNAAVDLKQLAVDRGGPGTGRRRRHWLARFAVPAVLLAGFAGMFAWAARNQWLPARPVSVVPVVVARAEVRQSGAPLFQAPGWVEPRPTPVLVTALAEGVVEELLVVEGQDVRAGEPVARLLDTDARLLLDQARADRALREAELAGAEGQWHAARQRLQHPLHLEAAHAEAESTLAKTQAELARLPSLIRAAKARVRFARQNLAGKRAAGGAIAGRLIQQAESELEAAEAQADELRERQPRLEREARAVLRKRDALARQRELLIEETGQAADAQAAVETAKARLHQAQVALEAAELRLERMVIRAPIDGRVLRLIARPGTRLTGSASADRHDSASVISLYDPKTLQVRADVRLEHVPLVEAGQPVRIETASAPEPIEGKVLSATSRADIQKNTLEVKVAVTNPPAAIRPEMLVQVTFVAAEAADRTAAETVAEAAPPERLLVPRQLVEEAPDGTFVWLADERGRARRRAIALGAAGSDALVEVADGLNPADKLIAGGRGGLSDGDRIEITGDDSGIGITDSHPSPGKGT